ncbi:hypothetical protein GCM10009840_27880 [Pseudolysinimonas kribbensis]|uniref:DUF1707 domain-containing protein n=1 Tax=Pseudolysinimonas kribbensis TaxID=433641 RepID=A0ABQ6K9X8_9MICO|nr:hypothetical protein [Pseudolysinimonas kribbensis]GMA96395.1 hypothetical protein GCM10025881_32190 [Pseudolysinimonas kribbensis]
MGFLGRLFGFSGASPDAGGAEPPEDAAAIERYRFVVRTAPSATIEQVHAEAFARLTDAQRAVIYEELSRGAGTGERPLSSEPATLARSVSRAQSRTPDALERVVGAGGPALLGAVAGYVVASPLVSAFLPWGGSATQDAGSGATAADDRGDAAV